jgi:diaminohydroxyphosphoribosylaminopyrimidine deaminase/5-amino-6-(5-phosphoribosylamino)uracil reductase
MEVEPMRLALRLARRAYGFTSPNPMVGAVLVRAGRVIGQGWHHRAGEPHAEIEALRDASRRGEKVKGATLYVTLEPCCTHGRTPPCTEAIIVAGIRKVVVGATDPNPAHQGRAFSLLRRAGILVEHGRLETSCSTLNKSFNHWVTTKTPFVTVKAAMTLDGKIATAQGESKWITGDKARAYGMKLRQGADAILVGVNTVLADNPRLTVRTPRGSGKVLKRIVLDSRARTPLEAAVVSDEQAAGTTTLVVTSRAPQKRVSALQRRVRVVTAPLGKQGIDLGWLLQQLGTEQVTSLLVEGGGQVNASFLLGGFAQEIAFFYAPKILGGRDSLRGVAGEGVSSLHEALRLSEVRWQRLGVDWLLTARVQTP